MAITIVPVFTSSIATDAGATARGEVTPTRWNQGSQLSGATATAVLFVGAGGTALEQDSTNFLFTTTSGPRLQVGGGTAGAGITVTGGTITSNSNPLLVTSTRNAAGVTFDAAIKAVITDTASASGSLALQVLGGASATTNLLSVDKNGVLSLTSGSAGAPTINFGSTPGLTTGFYATSGNIINTALGGAAAWAFGNAGANPSGSAAAFGYQQWNSGTAMAIYGSSAGAGNSNRAADAMDIYSGRGTGSGAIGSVGLWSGPANGTATALHVPELIVRGRVITTGEPILSWGGVTSSFPAIKRSGAKLQARLADDSAAGTFEGKYNSSDGTAGVASFTGAVASITIKDGIVTAIS